jgi:hypothetical protein
MRTGHLLFGAVLCCATASCGDATGPTGMVVVTVSPDTIQLSPSGSADILYRRHTVSVSAIQIWHVRLDVESESTPGAWSTVACSEFLQCALGNAETMAANGDVGGVQEATLTPGRYRLRYTYRVTGPDAMNASGPEAAVNSNVFVVVAQ